MPGYSHVDRWCPDVGIGEANHIREIALWCSLSAQFLRCVHAHALPCPCGLAVYVWSRAVVLALQLLFCAALRLCFCLGYLVLCGGFYVELLWHLCLFLGGLIGFRGSGVRSAVAVMVYEGKSSLAVGHWSCCSCSFSGAYFVPVYIMTSAGRGILMVVGLYGYLLAVLYPKESLLVFLWLMTLQLLLIVHNHVDGYCWLLMVQLLMYGLVVGCCWLLSIDGYSQQYFKTLTIVGSQLYLNNPNSYCCW